MNDTQALQVSIELGEGYEPSDRITAAIRELAAAIHEAHGEVEGFALSPADGTGIRSLQASWSPTAALNFAAWSSIPGADTVAGTPVLRWQLSRRTS